ncbi:MAG: Flp pilus assembly complex ATPase component TadA [Candidatus Omnitrophica bacterium]|nr:Flp pilus assembly complex ATPase component TadA [Candidatus Omnitrophota bacterium]
MQIKEKIQVNAGLKNRRQFARVRAQLAMQYRVLHDSGTLRAWNSTVTKNLSAAGFCFESFHPLGLNAELEVNLKIPFFEIPVVMKARIVRAAEIKAGEVYGVAAAITDIKKIDRQKLQGEIEQIDIIGLLQLAMHEGAADVHLTIGHPPMLRRAGQLQAMKYDTLDRAAIKRMLFSLLSEDLINKLSVEHELNTAVTIVTVTGTYRFRVNAYFQQNAVEAAFHLITIPIPSLEDLKLPEVVSTFAENKPGLVLITGPAGCGKTTTCAALIEKINRERSSVIMTFQSPIEYVFEIKNSVIKQREVGIDTESFARGVKQAMQQDVDVLVLSDIPDVETLKLAIDAAACGKLVYIVISSSGVAGVLNKIINMFAPERHYYVRKVLSDCLRGVIFQKLMPRKDNYEKLAAAAEVLVNTPAVAAAIREGLFDKISSIMKNNTQS